MSDSFKVPMISDELIEWLKRSYPISTGSLSDEPRDFYYRAGQQQVIRFLEKTRDDIIEDRRRAHI